MEGRPGNFPRIHPQFRFLPNLGIQGNIEVALKRIQQSINRIFNEENNRAAADTENREAVEQSLTDLYLDGIQAQQDITDIQLQLLGG